MQLFEDCVLYSTSPLLGATITYDVKKKKN